MLHFQHNILLSIWIACNTLMEILCSQWLPKVWNSWTSINTEFPPLKNFARLILQLLVSLCRFFCLLFCLSSVSEGLLCWVEIGNWRISQWFALRLSWLPFLVLLGHYPGPPRSEAFFSFAAFGWVLVESEVPYTSEVISYFHQQSHHQ